jgi:hypothetical protein
VKRPNVRDKLLPIACTPGISCVARAAIFATTLLAIVVVPCSVCSAPPSRFSRLLLGLPLGFAGAVGLAVSEPSLGVDGVVSDSDMVNLLFVQLDARSCAGLTF